MNRAFFLIVVSLLLCGAREADDAISVSAGGFSQGESEWRIDHYGVIVDSRPRQAFLLSNQYTLVTRRTEPNPAHYRKIEALLAPLRRRVGQSLACGIYKTEGTGGLVQWGTRDKIDYYDGCSSAEMRSAVGRINEARRLVGLWIAEAPVISTRDMTQ